MNSKEKWLETQVKIHGEVIKPVHYKIGQFKAIERFVGRSFIRNKRVLDVGCGTGEGMLFFHAFGAKEVSGVDINHEKIEVARNLGMDAICANLLEFKLFEEKYFDIIWCSHTFEHAFYPGSLLLEMMGYLKDDGKLFFVLPYPDTGDEKAHCASHQIGTRIDDRGSSVVKWFENYGLKRDKIIFDTYREPEIWISFVKI